ncbi:response regulator [Clostridium sp. C2-6-12]|uniref:response regulator transcription factor n=1 Tax=Clostridium sp. C2-6-12 TaxID=2698832 RepID=UPI00136C133F|nr:response regulator [Clostridium sp. C2-6-12]
MRIVVVDDDRIIRIGLGTILKRLFSQYEIVYDFPNGAVVLEYLKNNESFVDLVITDIKMPVMTGIELIEKAEKELKNPPVFIVLSGYDEFSYVRDSMKAGAFNYLLKPIQKDELSKVIKEVEIKIENDKKHRKLLSESREVLKKDFFKKILFLNNDINNRADKLLLNNIQLDEDYIYKMIVIEKNKKSEGHTIEKDFIKNILDKYDGIEYSSFFYDKNIYLIFYFKRDKYEEIDLIIEYIENEADIFIKNNRNVYILEYTETVWKLREYVKLVKKMKENLYYNNISKKYFLNESNKLLETLNIDNNNSDITVIKLAKEYIINNFNKSITLKDVAEEVFLSQNYLSELFKKEIGEGFYDFLSNYRIKKAKEILLTTNLKVYEVAKNVGYNDAITFGRAFKKITGTTPNDYRNNKYNSNRGYECEIR